MENTTHITNIDTGERTALATIGTEVVAFNGKGRIQYTARIVAIAGEAITVEKLRGPRKGDRVITSPARIAAS